MYVENRSKPMRVLVDVLGVLLIIAAGLTGWLPGPGGIPLLILGLSLLATNHAWAERLLLRVKHGGNKLADQLFDAHPVVKLAIDLVGILLIAGGVILLVQATRSLVYSAAISLLLVATVLLLGNRRRFSTLKHKVKRS
jgi:hypothetical protein